MTEYENIDKKVEEVLEPCIDVNAIISWIKDDELHVVVRTDDNVYNLTVTDLAISISHGLDANRVALYVLFEIFEHKLANLKK